MDRRNIGCKNRRWIKVARVCVQWRTTNVSSLFNTDFTCLDYSGGTNSNSNSNNNNNNNKLQLGCHPVAVVILHVYKI